MSKLVRKGIIPFIIFLNTPFALAQEGEHIGVYTEPTINQELFRNKISMTNMEREEYATHLASIAVKLVTEKSRNQNSLDKARILIGLALHLSPRNKKCHIANAKLKRGMTPNKIPSNYSEKVFAKLLLERALLLEDAAGMENQLLARFFIALSANINPHNEDALYETEIRRIDHGELAWEIITDPKIEHKK